MEKTLLQKISSEISKRGIIDVLGNQVADRGVYFDLYSFQPKSYLNPDLQKLYSCNKFTLVGNFITQSKMKILYIFFYFLMGFQF